MSFEEEFDSIIRRKAEEEQYPFNESHWEKASSMLDAERAATRASGLKKLYLPAVLALVIGVAGFLAFEHFNAKSGNAGPLTHNSQLPAATSTAPAAKPAALTVPVLNAPEASSTDHSNTATSSAASLTSLPNTPTTSHLSHHTTPATQAYITASLSRVQIPDRKASPAPAVFNDDAGSVDKTQNPGSVSGTIASADLANSGTAAETGNAGEAPSNPGRAGTSGAGARTGNGKTEEEGQTPREAAQMATAGPAYTATGSEQVAASANTGNQLSAEQLSSVYALLPYEGGEAAIRPTPFSYLNRYDDDYYKNRKTPKVHYMNVEAGADYLLGWDARQGKDGKGFNGFAGINYGVYLSDKLSLSLGVQAYNIGNIKQPFYLVSSKEYGFGSRTIYTRVTSNQLYYVALPLRINYTLNSTNTIGLGLNAGYLVSADNTISNYYVLDNEEKSIGGPAEHNKGIYEGTKRTNIMLSAHYKTKVSQRISLNLELNYGLTDIFKNMGDIKNMETPVGIRLGLGYTLFDK